MLYHVQILKTTYLGGRPRVIEKRVHTARSDVEAIQHVKETFSFSADRHGLLAEAEQRTEIYRWFKPEAKSADSATKDPC